MLSFCKIFGFGVQKQKRFSLNVKFTLNFISKIQFALYHGFSRMCCLDATKMIQYLMRMLMHRKTLRKLY